METYSCKPPKNKIKTLYKSTIAQHVAQSHLHHSPSEDKVKTSLGMKSLSSAERAQSFIPLLPFMGKLMSLETAETGSRWMVITDRTRERQINSLESSNIKCFTEALLRDVYCRTTWPLFVALLCRCHGNSLRLLVTTRKLWNGFWASPIRWMKSSTTRISNTEPGETWKEVTQPQKYT